MRISEIIRPSSKSDLADKLATAGYQKLGSSSNGDVFQKPGSTYVLKIFDTDDRAYTAFVSMVKENPNPHFPRFFSKSIKVNEDYSAIKIELLTESPDNVGDDIQRIWYYLNGLKRPDSIMTGTTEYNDAVTWINANPLMKQACDLIHLKLGQFVLDIKIDNMMMRGNVLVMIDPVKTR